MMPFKITLLAFALTLVAIVLYTTFAPASAGQRAWRQAHPWTYRVEVAVLLGLAMAALAVVTGMVPYRIVRHLLNTYETLITLTVLAAGSVLAGGVLWYALRRQAFPGRGAPPITAAAQPLRYWLLVITCLGLLGMCLGHGLGELRYLLS